MNKELANIKKWKAPVWHQDFGDSIKEFSLLKELSEFIVESNSGYILKLDNFEEGYMMVHAFKEGVKYFDFQVTDIDQSKIGIFFENHDEIYISKPSHILKYL